MISRKNLDLLIIALIYLALVPVIKLYRLTDFMIFAIFVLSYDLLYGHMGRLSFGHMLFYGIGAYAAALFSIWVSPNSLLSLAVAVVAGGLLSLVVSPITIRATGSCFALINQALNQVGYFLTLTALAKWTGGEDGLAPMFEPALGIDPFNPKSMFVLVIVLLLLVFYIVKRVQNSPFGVVLKGIRQNETRVEFLGYDTGRIKRINMILSGSIAAMAGALSAMNFGYVSTSFIDPMRNIEVVFAALIGGPGTLYGPLIGGTVYMTISNYLSSYLTRWEMFLGLVLLVLVFRFPRGIVGQIERSLSARRHKTGGVKAC